MRLRARLLRQIMARWRGPSGSKGIARSKRRRFETGRSEGARLAIQRRTQREPSRASLRRFAPAHESRVSASSTTMRSRPGRQLRSATSSAPKRNEAWETSSPTLSSEWPDEAPNEMP